MHPQLVAIDCVQSYGRACRAEECAIFSLRTDAIKDGKLVSTSHLTIEVDRETRKIVQVRGKWNRYYAPGNIPLLRNWRLKRAFLPDGIRGQSLCGDRWESKCSFNHAESSPKQRSRWLKKRKWSAFS